LLSREARRSRAWQVAREHLEVGAPLTLRERVLELKLAVEMVFDDRLVAAGDEDEMLNAGLTCLVDHVLDQRPVDTGSISFGTALVAGRNLVPRPATGKTALRMGVMDQLCE
jgi:hypothetical protein